jgi:hypothetical protein
LVNEQLIEGKIMRGYGRRVRGRIRKKKINDDLRQIFQFFRWNAEFQKQRKELLISYLTSNEGTK